MSKSIKLSLDILYSDTLHLLRHEIVSLNY